MKKAIQVLPLHDRHRAPKLCKQGPTIEEIHAATGHDIGLYVSAMLVLDVSQGNPPPWVGPWSELAHAVMAKADALWPEPFNKLQGRDEFGMVGAAFMTAKSSWTRHDSLAEIGVTVECCDLDRQVIKYVRISASHLHHDLPPLEEVVREIIESELTA